MKTHQTSVRVAGQDLLKFWSSLPKDCNLTAYVWNATDGWLTMHFVLSSFFNLAAIQGHGYYLHDDFYDYDTGEATERIFASICLLI